MQLTDIPEIKRYAEINRFSKREVEVFQLLVSCITTTDAIGTTLGVSPNTASNHLKSLLQKTGKKSKTELVADFLNFCLKSGSGANNKAAGVTQPVLVLVADDDPDDRHFIERAIEKGSLPVEAKFVENGEELLDFLYGRGRFENEAPTRLPHFILLDLNMPGKGGLETLREIKMNEKFRVIPTIIFTTSSADDDIRATYGIGANSFITKPTDLSELVDTLQNLGSYWSETVETCHVN